MARKFLAVLLAATAIFAFSACKKDEANQPDSDIANNQTDVQDGENKAEEGEIDYNDGLSTERFDGYNFRILVKKGSIDTQAPEEDSEALVTSAIYKRNKQIEEKYGITITASESSSGNYDTDALNSILAGDDAYDIIFTHSRAAVVYAVQGAAYNIHDIESIHLDKPWWTKDIADSFTLNGRLYVLDGDISLNLGRTMCILFNKNLFDEFGFDYPYESVRNGDWTFDEFAYIAKKGGKDLNGDGVIKPQEDQFGFYTRDWTAPINILYTGGQKIYDKDDEGNLEITLYSNKTVEIFDEFFNLMDNDSCYLHITEGSNINTGDSNGFAEGRIMMTAEDIGTAEKLRNMDNDFGIIPFPKFDEDDEYANIINGSAPLMIIPITVPDVERTGAITEALCAYGSKDVIPAFYEVSLKTKYSRDDDSSEMMDLIKDSIVYDVGYTSGGSYQSVGRDLAISNNRDFASFYARYESAAEIKLADFNRDYAGIEE